uniref:Cyclin D1 binding protein 1 n=1 Tax=Sphenodon punctatus TaxID=8508 RepID=A0A8D0HDC9_SPHPU
MVQLSEVILRTPLQSLTQQQLISTGGVWEACDQIAHLPRDNQAAVVSAVSVALGVVRDALEEMEQAQVEGGDPYSDILEDEELGSRGNRDVYWSEADRQLLGPCMGLVKASKASLKKVLGAVKAHGKAVTAEQVAQLDDIADSANEISPSVDDLALSMYPPMNQLTVRFNVSLSLRGEPWAGAPQLLNSSQPGRLAALFASHLSFLFLGCKTGLCAKETSRDCQVGVSWEWGWQRRAADAIPAQRAC